MFRVDTISFRASQYDHVSDEYQKKPLSQRSVAVGGHLVQRDLYSAFLLKNSSLDLSHADRTLCEKDFETFLVLHDQCIRALVSSSCWYPGSFGVSDFTA